MIDKTWRKVEDDRTDDKKLFMARGDKRHMEICRRLWYVLNMKNRIEALAEKLKLSKIPKKLWTYVIVDFITKLPLVAEKDVILVVCDRLSKMTYFVTTTKEALAEELVWLFKDNV